MEILNPCTAIITAAGSGLRLKGDIKKQFRLLDGIPVLIRTLSPFFTSEVISSIIVTAPEEDVEYCNNLILQFFEPVPKPFLVLAGGLERQDSVFGALQQCPPDTGIVFIHDAVRPFIDHDLIEELYDIATEAGAVVPAARLKHTIKSVEGEFIEGTLVRDRLIQVFTPQVFKYKVIMNAYLKAYNDGFISTDDSALVEYYGHKVRYHLTGDLNIKITDAQDLALAQVLLERNIII
ncbi:MAG TPA: 2-C-methyl-D-erythritol 4-phosphate cytidylyltransferase [Candidatus Cloacimonadota bacterium]|nr:2-C-methyl-D-erythritol 4-phosphate cytidylyltransferase [Candidatus Cloacimonadota bacterium]